MSIKTPNMDLRFNMGMCFMDQYTHAAVKTFFVNIHMKNASFV